MSTERLKAFFDAVLAIIITILVLDLKQPPEPSIAGLQDLLREDYFTYALSFFWLGALWINSYKIWEKADRLNNSILWLAILTLFFASLVPYVTKYVGEHFYDRFSQMFYGSVIILVSICNFFLDQKLAQENKNTETFYYQIRGLKKWMILDIAGKCLGLVLAYFIWPPLSMICILFVSLALSIYLQKMYRDYKAGK